ncbi:putative cell wall binding repeat protein [Kineococcus xinjiangensis]|uniref:Putative cell wall binding repeat protein n=1 Tax=Kineococcus xinjiangensis TaxID=512762 RepID=A0A2S6IG30_9ACTN|nr:cell wall-binding repeat-containing protein [Kineococcus xinjiangensis]PPK93168.1 putative cell wall binding repeat protein [Kineococcus xinjiangensis]
MTAATSRLRRRGIGAGVAALVGLTSAGFAGTASAAAGFDLQTRIGGDDRFETAALAAAAFEDTTSVVLVNGFSNVDALSAASLAQPILLTERDTIPDSTLDALKELGVRNITIVGGPAVVSQKVEDALKEPYNVARISGDDRFGTAAAVARTRSSTAPYVFVANGLTGIADALTASTVAAATGSPILLVRPDSAPAGTAALAGYFEAAEVVALGGRGAVSAGVAMELGVEARAEGEDRFGTAAAFADWAIAEGVFKGDAIGLARGISTGNLGANDLADALIAGPLLGAAGAPLLLSRPGTDLGPVTTGWLKANAGTLTAPGFVFGGVAVVDPTVVSAAVAAAEGDGDHFQHESFYVDPYSTETLARGGTRVYTVAGLETGDEYRITLVNAEKLGGDENGYYTFTEQGTSGLIDPGTVAGDITVVNGVQVGSPGSTVGGIAPATDGSLRFTVTADATAVEAFYPVVFVDAGNDTSLEIDENNLSTEAFGVGGKVQTLPAEAGQGNLGDAEGILVVDEENDTIVTTDALYDYDANDLLYIGSVSEATRVTESGFESMLSVGDELTADTSYQPDPEMPSTFVLRDTTPAAPGTLLEMSATDLRGQYS